MADVKAKYPATSSVALTFDLASLASDSSLLAGRSSAHVDNTSTLDLDHLVHGRVRTGTSPADGAIIELWAWAAVSIASGTPTFPDSILGTDSNQTMSSRNVMYSAMRQVEVITVDGTSNRYYPVAPVSIAGLFGGVILPPYWGLFAVQNTGAALNATQVALQFTRLQSQVG